MRRMKRSVWLPCVCIVWFILFVGCSAQQRTPAQAVDDPFASDPFDDPFFAQAPAWDASVLQQSEILSQQKADVDGNNTDAYGDSADAPGVSADARGIDAMEEEESTLEKGRNIVFTSVAVGASLANMFLLPLLIP